MVETRNETRTQTAGADMRDPGMPAGQAPARAGQPQNPRETAMERARRERNEKYDIFMETARAEQARIELVLRHHGISFDFFMAALDVGLRGIQKGNDAEKFFEVVRPASFLEAVLKCCHLGLLPDGKEAAIVRFADTAACLPMVEGFVKILWATGAVVEINHNVVCDGDDFDFQEGDDGYVTHRRSLRRAEDAETIGAWCVIKLSTGGKLIEICDLVDLKKIAAVSKAKSGPRADWQREMHRKAPFRRVVKRMPKSQRLGELIAHDDNAYDLTRLAAPADGPPAIAPAAMFSDRVAYRRAKPKADETLASPQGGAEDSVPDETALVQAISAVRAAADITALAESDVAARELATTDEERAWVAETVLARQRELAPADDEAFVLTAVISSASGVREYDDVDLWKSDILAKLDAAKGDALKKFWAVNLSRILDAGEAGFDEQAERILDVAKGHGLPTETADG